MSDKVEIVAVDPGHRDAIDCLKCYFQELEDRFDEGFDPKQSAAPMLDDFIPPNGVFVVAYAFGRAVGCGGFKRLNEDTAYLKRMWVDPQSRGLGLGKALLAALEEKAAKFGYEHICLDTHRSLEEAKSLYERSGFHACDPQAAEPYADHWFIKSLTN